MGYSTNFTGKLKFKKDLKAKELALLNQFLGKDRRDIGFEEDNKAYIKNDEYWYHIDFELTPEFDGLQWNGAEKCNDLHHIANFLTRQMRIKYPNFELVGEMSAQGEEVKDRWILRMEKGIAKKIPIKLSTKKINCPLCKSKIESVICPKCEQEFILKIK